jgi:hypothetical protein
MEVKNLGFWRTVVSYTGSVDDQSKFDVVWTEKNAIHASLIYNPEFSGDLKWRVLFWRSAIIEDTQSRIWNPNYEDPLIVLSTPEKRITQQSIPDWEPPFASGDSLHTFRQLLFCSGHTFLADGKLLVMGGHIERSDIASHFPGPFQSPQTELPYASGHPLSYVFDPFDTDSTHPEGKWKHATFYTDEDGYQYMNEGRWYPGAVQLPDGRVVSVSGYKTGYQDRGTGGYHLYYLVLNDNVGIYHPDTESWETLTDRGSLLPETFYEYEDPVQRPYHEGVTYPAAFVIPYGDDAGKIFYATPIRQSYILDPDGNSTDGFWFPVGSERTDLNCASCTFLLPLDPANNSDMKVVSCGGCCHMAIADVIMINLNPTSPAIPNWSNMDSMNFPRTHANAVLLPDGNVLVVGGNEMDNYSDPVYHAELFIPNNPTGEQWTILPEMQFQRNYHSTALLLPDGRVWVGGGDYLLSGVYKTMANIEIYTPQYLLEGDRPVIVSTDRIEIAYNDKFGLVTDIEIEKVILIKQGTTTHALNTSQRAIYLEIDSNTGTNYTILTPDTPEIAPPGWYMVFAVLPTSASDSGTQAIPSVAKFLHLS